MANNKSAKKRIRQIESRRLRNRYQFKSTRTLIKKLRATTSKKEAEEMLPGVMSAIDRLAKKNLIHANKASNNISRLKRHVNSLK